MAATPGSPTPEADLFDPSVPFKGVVLCCTSIPPEQRTEIASKTAELGGIHKYDLTPDVTHLIVGEYDTPKYRHVAKDRPDIRPMAAGWVEAVRDLWIEDAEIDLSAMEDAWKLRTLETGGGAGKGADEAASRPRLLCCLTGFDDPDQREQMVDTIRAHGGSYTGDLTRKVTHLIASKPEGKKYAAAKAWNVHTVSVEWLQDSAERGMILEERCYDPILAPEERGRGAWNRRAIKPVSLGKRLRETAAAAQEEGRRKLRKTASMKMNSQKENLWGDILGKPQPVDPPAWPAVEEPTQPSSRASFPDPSVRTSRSSMDTQVSKLISFGATEEVAVFSSCCFYIQGFSDRRAQILRNSIVSLGGMTCHSLDEVASASGAQMAHRFAIVPQDSDARSHPAVPANVQLVTEFFVERCLYKTQYLDPSARVIGRPFPVFPIPGFDRLSVCTAGFTGVDLNQVDKAIRQLGARYDERFTAQSSLLVCSSLGAVRKQKLDLALAWRVPVVSADWLWACITEGVKVPIKRFLFKELRQRLAHDSDEESHEEASRPTEPPQEKAKAATGAGQMPRGRIREIDASAFAVDDLAPRPATKPKVAREESNVSAEFETAPTHHSGNGSGPSRKASLPLSETSQDSLNKSDAADKRSQPSLPKPTGETPADRTDDTGPAADENEALSAGEPDKAPAKAILPPPPSDRLTLSAKLATLFETGVADTAPASATAAAAPASHPTVRRRRAIFGRAISNVSATSTGSLESSGGQENNSGSGVLAEVTAAAAADKDGGATGTREDRNLSSTQVGYDDPEAEMYKMKLMGGSYPTLAGGPQLQRRRQQDGLTLATSGAYDVLAQTRGPRTRRSAR